MHTISAKLLVIDDDKVLRDRLAGGLEAAGFVVFAAAEASTGWQLFEHEQPNLVICSLTLPDASGPQLVQNMVDSGDDIPVIVITKADSTDGAVEALKTGAVGYLIRPLDDLALVENSVTRALDRARLRCENRRYRGRLEEANRELQASLNLLQEDLNAGRQVQMKMLPTTPWQMEEICFEHKIIPSLYLSGDFVDYAKIDNQRIVFYLADVSGHGASSAFVTVLLKFMVTRLLYKMRNKNELSELCPSRVLSYLNSGLLNCQLGKHVTMVFGLIDVQQNNLTYSVGGHLPLPVLLSNGEAIFLKGKGFPVGLFEEATYQDISLPLPNTFSLVLCSDGIFDLLPGDTLKAREAALPEQVYAAGGRLIGLRQVFGLDTIVDMPDDIALLVLSRNLS